VVVYFIIMTQMFYPITLAIIASATGQDPVFNTEPTLLVYSQSYIAIALFLFVSVISLKTDLTIFMRASSVGIIFLIMMMIFIVAQGVKALFNTEFTVGDAEQSNATDWTTQERTITLVNDNFSPIAGVLCAGYCLHGITVPILKKAKHPENNQRDLLLGYFFVFLTYIVLGALGYIGFMGVDFMTYFELKKETELAGQID